MTAPASTVTTVEIARRVAELAALRRTAAASAAGLKAARETFERLQGDAIAAAKQDAAAVDVAETALRAIVAAHYHATHEKKPAPGVEVKLRSNVHYNADEAFQWAKQAGVAILPERLDVKAFEKIAKASRLPFCYEVVEPLVTIATDLDKALAAVPAAIPASEEA